MSRQCKFINLLRDFFKRSNEQSAIEFRKYLIQTGNPVLDENPHEETDLEDWIDGQSVMQTLHISPRTLQTLRSNGTLPYSRIGRKLYYRRNDILKLLSDNYIMRKIRSYESNK
ncbi:helix-turn-helix domain-containing protein [Bacteroidales bacterium OttesenSCG-928-B11]|nr:helix-turn-helix domain-containing protein [Bacteroidales bacterium OttesenSCG-928-B11]MDL2326805.1 helix-turn-helix domain-containing protein [Bacteroidales bacterium OttesenSCG-928-A14]